MVPNPAIFSKNVQISVLGSLPKSSFQAVHIDFVPLIESNSKNASDLNDESQDDSAQNVWQDENVQDKENGDPFIECM